MPLQFHPEATNNFYRKAEELFQKVVFDPHVESEHRETGFSPDIVRHEIPAEEVISLSRDSYVAGPLQKEVVKTFRLKDSVLGLFGEDYKSLVCLAESMQTVKPLQDKLAFGFLLIRFSIG